ncbi:MAG: hypothetical protein A2021_05385, partial [Elusimicrobia bacterium GWF2_52_66]
MAYKISVCLILFCACNMPAPYVHAGFSKDGVGTASSQILKLGAGARAAGMGNAFAAVADDPSAVYWNPGGLAGVKKESVSFMHAILIEDISYDWLAYVQPLSAGTFGAGIQRLSYGDIMETDETGLDAENFTPGETAGTLSYGVGSGNFGFGASLKYISGKIKKSASAIAADIGGKYGISPDGGFSLGFVLQNIGGKIKYVSESDPLPLNLKIGTAYKPGNNWTVSADTDMPSDSALRFSLGSEYGMKLGGGLTISWRAGYNNWTQDLGGLAGFAAGVGGNCEGLALDYAFVPFGGLGNTHKISLSID